MSALPKTESHFTAEEYFAHEERAEVRSEYFQGELFAMTGGSANHNRITRNLTTSFTNTLLGERCEAFATDLRLWVKQHQLYTYPDVMIICGKLIFAPGRMDTVSNPVVICEVLSPSTEAYDRGKKFEFYRSIESLQHYLLIDQDRYYIEQYERRPNGIWQLSTLDQPDDVLKLASIEIELVLAEVYERVEWGQE